MSRLLCILLALCCAATAAFAADDPSIKCPSPDKRFALRMTKPSEEDSGQWKTELIEMDSGKVLAELGFAYGSHLTDTVLVWSADSKRVAYATRDNKEGEVSVYFRNGAAFEEVTLPDNLPSPDIKFGKGADGGVKNYGGAVIPLRWLKSGDLELSNDLMMLSREDGHSYTGVIVFSLAFDAKRHATVHNVGKTKTRVDK